MKIEVIKALIVRHIRSEGFQRRWRNIYWPFIKKWSKKTWAFYRDRAERTAFGEQYASQVFVHDEVHPNIPAGAPATASTPLPQYDEIADRLNAVTIPSDEQGSTGQCVAFTFANFHTHMMSRLFGAIQRFSEYDIYRFRDTKAYAGDDRGMYPDKVAERMVTGGVALRGVLPDVRNGAELKLADEQEYHEAVIDKFRVKGIIASGGTLLSPKYHGFDAVADAIRNMHEGEGFQISVTLTDGYFGNDMPVVSGNVIGRHSVLGIGGFAFVDYGKRCIRIVDSAHRKGRATRFKDPSIRHFTEEFLTHDVTQATIRIFALTPEINAKLEAQKPVAPSPTPTPTPTPTPGLITRGAQLGEEGAHVKVIQEGLIARGYGISAGATGYYGEQTSRAVLQFQLNNLTAFAKLYGQTVAWTETRLRALAGNNFGPKSVSVFNYTQ